MGEQSKDDPSSRPSAEDTIGRQVRTASQQKENMSPPCESEGSKRGSQQRGRSYGNVAMSGPRRNTGRMTENKGTRPHADHMNDDDQWFRKDPNFTITSFNVSLFSE